MTKFRIVPILILCFLLASCSSVPNEDDLQVVTDASTEITSEVAPITTETVESRQIIDLGEGYSLEVTDITQGNGDLIYYLWHKDRENLRSAFPVPPDSEIIHEKEQEILYFINCPESMFKIGLSTESDSIHYLGFDVTNATYETVVALFNEALIAYSWFALDSLTGTEFDEDSGYIKVEHETFYEYDAFIQYLNTLFTDDVIQSLLSWDLYRNIDGALYVAPFLGRGTDAYICKWHYGVEKVSDDQLVFTVYLEEMTEDFYRNHEGHYPYKDPVDVQQIIIKTYLLEKIDGLWKFKTFEYPV